MTANQIPEAVLEAVARAICVSCEENPDHRGDARGNEFRWQDYRDAALAAISAFTAAQQQGQSAVVDEAMVERIAALLHEEATDEPWTVAGVEHPGPDRDYYRGLARKVAALAAAPQQPAGRAHDLAARLVDELDGLVGESDGVSGLHRNGDVATWDELLPGGRFERLSSLDELRAALAAQQQGGRADAR